MQIKFSTKNPKQFLASEYWIDQETEEILFGGAKGGGKSYLGASLVCADALIYPETHYFIARAELIDLTNFTLPTVHEVFKNWGLDFNLYASYNGQTHCINLHNGSKIFLLACKETPSDPLFERFGSMQMTRGWIEEGGEVPENAKANLWLSIGRWKNDVYNLKKKLLITANPKKGWMKRDFVDPFKQNLLPKSRKYIQSFATDNTYLSEDYVNTLRNEKNVIRRQRLFEGNWDYDEDQDSLISYDALTDCFTNTIVKDGQKYLIVDVARKGKDTTVFSIWDGLELIKVEQFSQQATNITEDKVKDYARLNQIPFSNIMIDEDGIGGGVVDHLFGVKGFVANSTPLPTRSQVRMRIAKIDNEIVPKTNFKSLKTQCAFKLAELINERKIAFRVPELRDVILEELTSLLRQKDIDSDGKLQIKPKDEVKIELGRSPDIGDTLIYRAWFELQKEASGQDPEYSRVIEIQDSQFLKNQFSQGMNSTR
jgi:phage terminase large subunit